MLNGSLFRSFSINFLAISFFCHFALFVEFFVCRSRKKAKIEWIGMKLDDWIYEYTYFTWTLSKLRKKTWTLRIFLGSYGGFRKDSPISAVGNTDVSFIFVYQFWRRCTYVDVVLMTLTNNLAYAYLRITSTEISLHKNQKLPSESDEKNGRIFTSSAQSSPPPKKIPLCCLQNFSSINTFSFPFTLRRSSVCRFVSGIKAHISID